MSKEFFSIEEFKNRWAKVRSSMKSSNIELLMVISPTNVNYLIGTPAKGYQEFEVWVVVLGILTVGVLLGFFIALFQILSQKGELMSLRSKLKRLQVEIDNLRNESIDEDIMLSDSNDKE